MTFHLSSSASTAIFNSISFQYFLFKIHSIKGKLIISQAIFTNLFSLQVIYKYQSLSKYHKSQVL